MSWNAVAVRDIDKPSSNGVICPDGQSCPDGNTCYRLSSGLYGCCIYFEVHEAKECRKRAVNTYLATK